MAIILAASKMERSPPKRARQKASSTACWQPPSPTKCSSRCTPKVFPRSRGAPNGQALGRGQTRYPRADCGRLIADGSVLAGEYRKHADGNRRQVCGAPARVMCTTAALAISSMSSPVKSLCGGPAGLACSANSTTWLLACLRSCPRCSPAGSAMHSWSGRPRPAAGSSHVHSAKLLKPAPGSGKARA